MNCPGHDNKPTMEDLVMSTLVIREEHLAQNTNGIFRLPESKQFELKSRVSKVLKFKDQLEANNLEMSELLIPVFDVSKISLEALQFIKNKVCFRLQINNIKYKIIDEKHGISGRDILDIYSRITNSIILDARHLSKSKYDDSYFGVNYKTVYKAIQAHLSKVFYYNDDYKEYSHTKLLVKNYKDFVPNKNEELNINFTYKCVDFNKRNSKEFTSKILINYKLSEKEQNKILKSIEDLLNSFIKKNKINFNIYFQGNNKYFQFKYIEEKKLEIDKFAKYPKYITENALLYKFFGVEYKNFGSEFMPDIEYFFLFPELAMPESLGVDSLELVKAMLNKRGIDLFDELIDKTINEKLNTIGFKEEIENDEEDLY